MGPNQDIARLGAELISVLDSHKDIPSTTKVFVLADVIKIQQSKMNRDLSDEVKEENSVKSKITNIAEKENPNGRED